MNYYPQYLTLSSVLHHNNTPKNYKRYYFCCMQFGIHYFDKSLVLNHWDPYGNPEFDWLFFLSSSNIHIVNLRHWLQFIFWQLFTTMQLISLIFLHLYVSICNFGKPAQIFSASRFSWLISISFSMLPHYQLKPYLSTLF